MKLISRVKKRINREIAFRKNWKRIAYIASQVAKFKSIDSNKKPVVFFNASTRLEGMSLNAAYSLIASWAIRLTGAPIVHFVCNRGMSRCVLGVKRENTKQVPLCQKCSSVSEHLYQYADVYRFTFQDDINLKNKIARLDLEMLLSFSYQEIPLGKLILPSLRWTLRKHHLNNDDDTRFLARQFILSAWHIAREFDGLITRINPQSVVVFNGMFFPEATAKYVASLHRIPVYSHEVGMFSFSAFFTSGEATAYPIYLEPGINLTEEQNKRLDIYLDRRFKGDFTTAGIRFWQKIEPLGSEFWQRVKSFKQIVPVFTNVIFDTSQSHANVVFPHMFAWLDIIYDAVLAHPETFFIIRAHPDELRPGKESRETVAQWVQKRGVDKLPNVLFIDAKDYVSSYELINNAKFVMVYNSTIGLEASIKGIPVLCAGRARYTQVPTVFFPQSIPEFKLKLREFLMATEIRVPQIFILNARRVLYNQLFRASLPFSDFIEDDGIWKGFVKLKEFPIEALKPQNSPTINVLVRGILNKEPFLLNQ